MDEVTDSRTASFSLKRPHSDPSHPENSGGSSNSTPRKRARRANKLDTQDLRDFVPSGGTFSVNAASLDSGDDMIMDKEAGNHHNNSSDQQLPHQIPSMNWNAGAKAKIRVSLRDRTGTGGTPATSPQAISQQHSVCEDNLRAVTQAQEGPKRDNNQQSGAPSDESCLLHVGNVAYATTEATLQDVFAKYSVNSIRIPVNPRTSRSTGYAFVKISNLEDASRAIQELGGTLVDGRRISVQLAQHEDGQEASELNLQYPQTKPRSNQALSNDHGKESAPKQKTNENVVFLGSHNADLEPSPLKNGFKTLDTYEDDPSERAEQSRWRDSSVEGSISETESAVLVNILDNSEYESGEISDPSNSTADVYEHTVPSNGAISVDGSRPKNEHSPIEEIDAMMDYANTGAPIGNSSYHKTSITLDTQSSPARTLAELDQRELELQLRYFYVAQAPDRIDFHDPVRCLVCTEKGHTASECDRIKCSHCDGQDLHSTWNCPSMDACTKCYEPGHSAQKCPSKNRLRLPVATCRMCKRTGHVAVDCELHWRTSGRPWESDLRDRRIRFECYECGRPGHLGNDCSSRRPGKPKGSSSWTYHQHPRQAENPTSGFSIKGRAQQQQQPIVIDDSDDEVADFHRPKISKPAGPGKIKIMTTKTGQIQSLSHNSSRGQRPDNGFRHPAERYNDERRSASPRIKDHYNSKNHGYGDDSFSRPRGSMGFGHEEPLSYGHDSPPISARTRKSRVTEAYRPMPSSAKQAWRQFRI